MKTNIQTKVAINRLENEIKKIEGFIEFFNITGEGPCGYIERLAELKAKIRQYKINSILN